MFRCSRKPPAIQCQTLPAQFPQHKLGEKPNETEIVKPGNARIAAGTTLEFGLIHPLSSATARKGDDVPLRLLRPLIAGNTTVLAEGTVIHARVQAANQARPNCQTANLELTIDRLSFPDGTAAKVTALAPADDTKPVPYKTNLPWDPNWLEITGLVIVAVPLAIAGAVLYVVLVGPAHMMGIYLESNDNSIACAAARTNIELPATTRVAVVVNKNHTIHF